MVDVEDDGRSRGGSLVTGPEVVPARRAREPVVMQVGDLEPGTPRFLVVLPDGGASVQLFAQRMDSYPAAPQSRVVRTKGRTAVVAFPGADPGEQFRLVVTDAQGRTVYDATPPGRELLAGEAGPGWSTTASSDVTTQELRADPSGAVVSGPGWPPPRRPQPRPRGRGTAAGWSA